MTDSTLVAELRDSERELLLKAIDDGCGCETARHVRKLLEELDGYRLWATSVNEALNSGDGSYRP